jgi:hypothetical protein
MKKGYIAALIVLGSFLWLMGMGGMEGTPATSKVPTPERNFNARVVDRLDVQTALSQFSHDGKVFLTAKRGDATITIPFEKIAQIQFQGEGGKELQAKVLLKDQKGFDISLDKRSKFFGQAEFGTFQIEAKDLKSISFQP